MLVYRSVYFFRVKTSKRPLDSLDEQFSQMDHALGTSGRDVDSTYNLYHLWRPRRLVNGLVFMGSYHPLREEWIGFVPNHEFSRCKKRSPRCQRDIFQKIWFRIYYGWCFRIPKEPPFGPGWNLENHGMFLQSPIFFFWQNGHGSSLISWYFMAWDSNMATMLVDGFGFKGFIFSFQ